MTYRNTVLVHAPVGRDSKLTVRILADAGVVASAFPHFAEILGLAEAGNAGALLMTVEALPKDSILVSAEALKKQPHWSDLPVLILVPGGRESSAIGYLESVLSILPNLTLLERPIRPESLASVAKNALRNRTRQYEVQRIVEEAGAGCTRYGRK